tara:strand:+ start:375 stop:1931 length:1557 start_codon:yes stop_codon:yes gene_type:complete
MSKYNLSDILNEYIGGSRHGTINISYRDLQDAMDKIEADGDFVVRELPGPSGDGKVNREFEVVFIGAARGDNKQEEAGFTVYDYKFGFDPASENNFDEVLPFSIGGSNKEAALKIAKYLLGNRVQGYMANDKEILKNFDPKDINDVLFSFESNTDEEGEFKTSMGFNEELSKRDKAKIKKIAKQLKGAVKAHGGQAKELDKIVKEGDLFSSEFDRRELKDIINDLNKGLILDMPTRRAYKFLVSLLDKEDKEEMGLNEQMYIDDDEFEMEMGRSKKDSLKKEMIIHVDQLIDGNIDMNDFMNVVEDIMAEVNSLKESTGPSDKAETEDDVVNVDKVAGPGAKGRNYGAETSANTAEDDMEDKEIANPKPMYEDMKLVKLAKKMGIDVDDLKKRIKKMSDTEKDKIEADAFSRSAMAEESDSFVDELQESTQEESVAKYIKDYYRNPKTGKSMISDDIVMEYYRTHKDWDQEGRWDGSKEGMRDGMEDFNEFFDANYGYMFDDSRDIDEDLKKHFKRFM